MAALNPRIHIICGMCGNNHMMKYRLSMDINDDTGEEEMKVNIIFENCSSITGLDEIIEIEIKNGGK